MKTTMLLTMIGLLLLAVPAATAGDSAFPANLDKAKVEKNLIIGLTSGNAGLQRSAALMLGKYKFQGAVIPLMALLRSDSPESVRIAAAWALCRIGDARGIYAVKMAVKYDDCCKVQLVSAWYYNTYVEPGTFVFTRTGDSTAAEIAFRMTGDLQ